LWTLTADLASGTQNFEVAPNFVWNICAQLIYLNDQGERGVAVSGRLYEDIIIALFSNI
jgi:hypothetical protein